MNIEQRAGHQTEGQLSEMAANTHLTQSAISPQSIADLTSDQRALLELRLQRRAVINRQSRIPPITRVARVGELALSFAQQRMWFLGRLEPGDHSYNIPIAVRLRGQLEVETIAAGRLY